MNDLSKHSHIEDIAQQLWRAYDLQAGGKTFDGKPLPTWHELGRNRQECWIAAAARAKEIFVK